MPTIVLAIRYTTRVRLESAIKLVLGDSNFLIVSCYDEAWTVRVPRALETGEISLVMERASIHNLLCRETDSIRSCVESQKSHGDIDIPQLNCSSRGFPSNIDLRPQQSLFIKVKLGPKTPNQRITQGLYAKKLESRETSKLFGITASISPLVNNKIQDKARKEICKLAIKRLNRTTALSQFQSEFRSLRTLNMLRHPNIVKTLSAFKYEENGGRYLNFAFPLPRGNLKQLFRGSYNPQRTAQTTLWKQFLGLASALTYMHDKAYMAHRDIKPSDILIYEEECGGLTLKIAEFGFSISLHEPSPHTTNPLPFSCFCATSIFHRKFSANNLDEFIINELDEPYEIFRRKQFLYDIWGLGCVFTELLSYLVAGGSNGVTLFRNHITTTEDNISSDSFNDTRFEDGERVKPQVHQWLDHIAEDDDMARRLLPTLRRMLASKSERPSAEEVCSELIELDLAETVYNDGIRVVRFTSGSTVEPPTAIDRLKLKVETWLNCPVDWRPFHGTSKICSVNQTLVSWTVASRQLFLVLPNAELSRYKQTCIPVLEPDTPVLPQWKTKRSGIATRYPRGSKHDLKSLATLPTGGIFWHWGITRPMFAAATSIIPQASPSNKEVYWCHDKVYTEPLQTILYEVDHWDSLQCDKDFYKRVNQLTRQTKGRSLPGWLLSALSWKRCTQVDFVKFYVVVNNRDQVLPESKEVPPITQLDYEHGVLEPLDIHMRLAGLEIVEGLLDPRIGADKKDIIKLLPRKRNPPLLNRKRGVEGWGLHARMGFSVHKFCRWIVVCFLANAAFVIVWLVCINPTDLQNAFVPASIVTTALTIGLAVMQSLEK
ncbi:kinase-like domain-containing protein [Xylaria telfairii]|nr:kinase-like domain-containing protein [Xylaria telfairii]